GEPRDPGGHHPGVDADMAGCRNLPAHAVEIAAEAWHVARERSVPAQRGRDRVDACCKWRIGLIGEAVIILDIVDAAACERNRQRGQRMRGQALRLERRARKRASLSADAPAESLDPRPRAFEYAAE